ncbi:alpha-amylase [Streptomyces sp. NPDC002580]|uniref:alpha-amylase n=1 Tax=Streptomyces sp. NPDC002580 TaxID=3364653 RepID=UPI0036AD67FD
MILRNSCRRCKVAPRGGPEAAAFADLKDATMFPANRSVSSRRLRTSLGLFTVVVALSWATAAPATARDGGRVAADEGSVSAEAAPDCVHHYDDWRYTTVVNDCDTTVNVTVDYTDGQAAPCRTLAPRDAATFAGYGPQLNYVTGLSTCTPATV